MSDLLEMAVRGRNKARHPGAAHHLAAEAACNGPRVDHRCSSLGTSEQGQAHLAAAENDMVIRRRLDLFLVRHEHVGSALETQAFEGTVLS